jgi:hypothetical protein
MKAMAPCGERGVEARRWLGLPVCGLDRFTDRRLDREAHVHMADAPEAVRVSRGVDFADDLIAGVFREREVLADLLII